MINISDLVASDLVANHRNLRRSSKLFASIMFVVIVNLAVNNGAAIAVNGLAGDRRAVVAGEEDSASGDLARLARTTHGGGELLLSILAHG